MAVPKPSTSAVSHERTLEAECNQSANSESAATIANSVLSGEGAEKVDEYVHYSKSILVTTTAKSAYCTIEILQQHQVEFLHVR